MFQDKVIPLDVWVSQFVEWLVDNYRHFFQTLKWPPENIYSWNVNTVNSG
jgi:glycine betaine/proline transport system permease protein